jgi:hypothetical protein
LTAILRPPFLLAGLVAKPLYRFLFSRSDERLAREAEQQLAADVHTYLPFLFSELNGRIVPNQVVDFPPPFDYAIVTMDVSQVLLRFTRGRDHLAVQVAPKSYPNNFHEVSTVLTALEVPGIQRGLVSCLLDAGRVLRQHMGEIQRAFTPEEYRRLGAQLQEVYARDRVAVKQLETELNRRLYDR